ncbi:MAG: hypothetical protein Q4B54_02675 [Coriobacteriales bacterium]|nr:hypothetical protein [Coriobacteriales bacterium]
MAALGGCLFGCGGQSATSASSATSNKASAETIEKELNLANMGAEWTFSDTANAWTLTPVVAVVNPEIENQQGVSVCVPSAYVKGVDTDGDGSADATSGTATGTLVIDKDAKVTSTNGQVYTATTAPVILNTGAAGYGSSTNTQAASTYAAEGYINVSCGNRGKQDTATDADGNQYYTGDAPCCLVDQKNAARFVKYNILLGNIPGNVDYFVSTGGSGGGAHAAMFAATSNNADFYPYEAAAGAVGVYDKGDGTYTTSVTIDGKQVELSDGAWGCVAYSAITSLAEADMALAFEYYLDPTYSFGSDFQKKTAEYMAAEYMDYINGQNLKVDEEKLGLDVDGDGKISGTVALTIEHDTSKYADTNGYGGTYLNLYLAEFTENLQWYLDNLDYSEGWTWFDSDGKALSDEAVASMSTQDKAQAFIEGRYDKGSTGGMGGGPGGDMGGAPSGNGPSDSSSSGASSATIENAAVAENSSGDSMTVGTPGAGSTQAAGSSSDSSNYSSYSEMLKSYQSDVAEVKAGDDYGNNIVSLYNPLNYIGAEGTDAPTWTRVVMGASEGDMSMFASLNMELGWLNSGTDAVIEWQWDGGHVPSEVLGNSLALWVDTMYGKYVDGAVKVEKPAAQAQTTNGDAESASGTDISSWVNASDIKNVSFSLADAAAYRTAGAAKAIPGFDVIDYGQEDYVSGSKTADARHWSEPVLKVFEDNASTLESLFNAG